MKKTLALVLAMCMLAACFAGCGSAKTETAEPTAAPAGDAAPSADAAPAAFKIGGTGPLTGGAAIYGNAVANGAKIYDQRAKIESIADSIADNGFDLLLFTSMWNMNWAIDKNPDLRLAEFGRAEE